jgi:starch phosphorylase
VGGDQAQCPAVARTHRPAAPDRLSTDEAFLEQMDRESASLDKYLAGAGWFAGTHLEAMGIRIAYFSVEFGLTECIPNYVGGLGILAGDHLKSASDPGLPEDPVLPHELAWIRWQE